MKISALEKAMKDFFTSQKKSAEQKFGGNPKQVANLGTAKNVVTQNKGSFPVAAAVDGRMLLSTGQKVDPKGYVQDQKRLGVLQKNVLDQLPFTPQARARLKQVEVGTFPRPIGSNINGYYNTQKGNVAIKNLNLRGNPFTPASTLVHEYMHALDGNTNNDPNFPVNSGNFYSDLNSPSTPFPEQRYISGFLNSYDTSVEGVKDIEGFAEYGADKGNEALLGDLGKYYNDIFLPMSKSMNYSPVYPLNSVYKDSLLNLFGE